jgi:hypothetical protein
VTRSDKAYFRADLLEKLAENKITRIIVLDIENYVFIHDLWM